jgi:hypothetical protein
LAREFARGGKIWILSVLYYVIFMPVSWAGSSLRVAAPKDGESLWSEREPFSARPEVTGYVNRTGLTASLLCCARRTNRWTICLLPFLLILTVLEADEQKTSIPSDIYTLY